MSCRQLYLFDSAWLRRRCCGQARLFAPRVAVNTVRPESSAESLCTTLQLHPVVYAHMSLRFEKELLIDFLGAPEEPLTEMATGRPMVAVLFLFLWDTRVETVYVDRSRDTAILLTSYVFFVASRSSVDVCVGSRVPPSPRPDSFSGLMHTALLDLLPGVA